jgi:hypothetical protein
MPMPAGKILQFPKPNTKHIFVAYLPEDATAKRNV